MRIRWRDFELPNQVVVAEKTKTDEYSRFMIEPFERGFGVTLGNSLRRILLSFIEGAAVYAMKIEGVSHEFTGIEGVYEDVTDIVLRLKQMRIALQDHQEVELTLEAGKKGPVTAGDIQCPEDIEIVNKDLVLLNLTENRRFSAKIYARKGRGYVTADELSEDNKEVGLIFLDACFSPVIRVRFSTEQTRVGQKTNYDRLIFEVWTNGIITPQHAMFEGAKIMRKHLNSFIQYNMLGSAQQPKAELPEEGQAPEDAEDKKLSEEQQRKNEQYSRPISELNLTVRARNCLESQGIATFGELVSHTEADLLKVDNLGKTTLNEIKRRLDEKELSLGVVSLKNSGEVQV